MMASLQPLWFNTRLLLTFFMRPSLMTILLLLFSPLLRLDFQISWIAAQSGSLALISQASNIERIASSLQPIILCFAFISQFHFIPTSFISLQSVQFKLVATCSTSLTSLNRSTSPSVHHQSSSSLQTHAHESAIHSSYLIPGHSLSRSLPSSTEALFHESTLT